MTMVAVLNSSSNLKSTDAAFLVEAVAAQVLEFAKAWNIDPWAISLFQSSVGLPASDVYIFEYVDKLDVDGALAYHSVDAGGRPYGRMLAPDVFRIQSNYADDATDLSHEVLEAMGDPTCDRWLKEPDGTDVAVEVCDPVQDDWYKQAATVAGETRQIAVSNYVLPPFFDAAGLAPFDRLGRLGKAFAMSPGGYEAVMDATGNEHDVFARLRGNVPASKLRDPGGRLLRRLRGRR